jgi:hypothetical protein
MSNQPQVNSNENFSNSLFLSFLNKTNEKNQAKEDQGLLTLTSVLSSMESALSGSMKGITSSSSDITVASSSITTMSKQLGIFANLQNPESIASIAKILGAATSATNKLEGISAKSASDQSNDMNKIGSALNQFAKNMPANQLLQLESLTKQMTETFFGTSNNNKGALNSISIEDMEKSMAKLVTVLTTAKDGAPSNYDLIQALSSMTSDLGHMQGTIGQVASNEAQSSATVSEALLTAAKAEQAKVEQEVAAQQAAEAKEKKNKLIGKIVGLIVSAIVAVCTFGAGAPVMATLMLGMAVLSATGALSDLSTAICKSLVSDGMSPQDAKAVADAITIVIVVAATVAAGAGSSQLLTKTVAEDSAEAVAKKAAKAAEKTTFQKFLDLNPMRNFSTTTNMTITAAIQASAQTGFITDAVTAGMKDKGATDAQVAAVVQNVKYAMAAVTIVVSAMTLDGGLNGSSANSITSVARFGANSTTAINTLKALDIVGHIVLPTIQGGIDFDMSALQLQTNNATTAVSQCEASVALFDAEQEANNKLSDISMNATAKTIQADSQVSQTTQQTELAFETTVTQILAQAM